MKTCANCGKLFPIPHYCNDPTKPFAYDKTYCSDDCEQEALNKFKKDYEKNKTRVCKVCGKTFNVPRVTDGHFSETPFCSDECRYIGRSRSQNAVQKQREETCLKKYGVIYPCLTKQCREANYDVISNINMTFAAELDKIGVRYIKEYVISKYAYDFYLPDLDILIEIDPSYTHTVAGNHFNNYKYNPYFINYHINKTNNAYNKHIKCIHIWDWDNWDKVIQLIKPKQKLYARKLQLKEVNKQDANIFIDKYHIQGKCRGNQVNLGLYNNEELVQVMTFGKPRYNKNYQWELLRLCSHSDYIIVGGAEKLFKHFVNGYKPESVLSYCDISKFTGNVYERLGFTLLRQTEPQKIWSKNHKYITDNLLRQRGADQLIGTYDGKGTNNEEIMIREGWLPIYDCGQKVFIWKVGE